MFIPNSTYYAEVDGQLIVTRDTYNVKSEREIAADREKRQILLGAVASGVLLNMGLSIYNNYEINQLRRLDWRPLGDVQHRHVSWHRELPSLHLLEVSPRSSSRTTRAR